MQTIQFKLSEEMASRLAERAKERGLSAEAFVQMITEEVLNRTGDEFSQAVDYVLSKNTDLYQRLAQ
mgnify:CR=1 FL=1|jgi:antitoxin FitA